MTSTIDPGAARRIPALDGVRGIAILLVLYHHFWGVLYNASTLRIDHIAYEIPGVGWIGVDLFFVLSGFLITGILMDAKDGVGYFRNFYARRFLRIFPLYYGFLAVAILILPLLPGLTDNPGLAGLNHYQVWYWTYLQNVLSAIELTRNTGNLWAGHLWSLAIEEQFYLLWPAVVLVCSRRGLFWVCITCVIGAPFVRYGVLEYELPRISNTIATYTFMPTRVDTLAAGALVAIIWRDPAELRRLVPAATVVAICACAIIAGYTIWSGALNAFDRRTQEIAFTTLAVGFSAFLVLVLAAADGSRLSRLCRHPILTFFGRYSYGIYVLHFPIATQFAQRARIHDLVFTVRGSEIPAHIVFAIGGTSLTVACAWLSWHLYESRFLKLKRHFEYAGVAEQPGGAGNEPTSVPRTATHGP